MYADYFLTVAKTSENDMTMFLIPRSEGVETRHMRMTGSASAGTAFVDFDDVLVPVANVVGEVGKGFKCIVSNFNHEVWIPFINSCKANLLPETIHLIPILKVLKSLFGGRNRVKFQVSYTHNHIANLSYRYASSRETFGQKLINHGMSSDICKLMSIADKSKVWSATNSPTWPAKRKLCKPGLKFVSYFYLKINNTDLFKQSLIFQIEHISPSDADLYLAGQIAQLKAHSGIVVQNVVRDAIQILGGIGLTRGGRGERVERIWRDVKAISVPGGSEEIMLDLSMKRAMRVWEVLDGKAGRAKI
jgi:alkylation response protein AidB-like acyl-CoA dehydrogenase